MSPLAGIERRWRQARWRQGMLPPLLGLPPLLALAWAWPAARWVAGLMLFLMLAWGWWRASRLDRPWLARQLDARLPALEDSSALLLGIEPPRSGLAQAQRQRLQQRLSQLSLPDLRAPWPLRPLLASVLLAIALALWLPLWPAGPPATIGVDTTAAAPSRADPVPPSLRALSLQLQPPAYTGLAVQRLSEPAASAPAGSTLSWALQLDGPDGCRDCQLSLRFHDGSSLLLAPAADGSRQGSRALDEDSYYRIEVDGQPLALQNGDRGPWRLIAVPDQPPRIEVIEPTRTLTLLEQAQASWPLAFEVSDDYGLGQAELLVTLAQGSGEQISVSERRLPLRGEGDAQRQRYRRVLDPAALGFVQGDDLIVRLRVHDRAQPTPQLSQSAGYILRWPARQGAEASGVEVSVQRAMPAYFRSQRQLIIDTEALIAERYTPAAGQSPLAPGPFATRADALGVDQRILRLRYGQFLGEEAEGAPSSELQERVAKLLEQEQHHDSQSSLRRLYELYRQGAREELYSQSPQPSPDPPLGHAERPGAAAPADSHAGHDHGARPVPASGDFGSAVNVLEEYGHTHDDAEATTLFDPATRELLREALNAMWQSELELRQAQPRASLPHQYRALEKIKQVQQASRIYLARVGLELPPIDFERRLTGEATGLARPLDPLQPAERERRTLAWWSASAAPAAPAADLLDQLRAWLSTRPEQVADPLGLLASAERWVADPDCEPCREAWRDALWPLLPAATAAAGTRPPLDALGSAWLQALPAIESEVPTEGSP